MYRYYYQATDPEMGTVSQLFYLIKEYNLIEISLSDEGYLWVKQWKDVPMTYEAKDKRVFEMDYGEVYLTDGTEILDVRDGWGEKELDKRLTKCKRKERKIADFYNKKYKDE